MRRTAGLISLLFAVFTVGAASAGTPAVPQDEDLSAVRRISQRDFKRALSAGTILVLDVRDAGAYASGHVPGAVSMPLDQVATHVQELKAERRPIVTYCA